MSGIAIEDRAQITAIDVGFLAAVSPKSLEDLRLLADRLRSLTSIHVSPLTAFFAFADAANADAIPIAQMQTWWKNEAELKALSSAIAVHMLADQCRFAHIKEVAWKDSHGYQMAVLGWDEESLTHYAEEWNEQSSPLELHHSDDVEIVYAAGQLHVTESDSQTVQRLADRLSESLRRPISLRQALFALVEDNVRTSSSHLSKTNSRVRIPAILELQQVARCAELIENNWERFSTLK